MPRFSRLIAFMIFAIGGLVGAGAIIASTEINRATSTDAFCTSCHSMAVIADDPVFKHSAHRINANGINTTCADCHIPKGNWFAETWAHASTGIQDVWAEHARGLNNDDDWNKRRGVLANEVREVMRRQSSATCRSCHDAASIAPHSQAGQSAHALLRDGHMTCVDCHANVVHAAPH